MRQEAQRADHATITPMSQGPVKPRAPKLDEQERSLSYRIRERRTVARNFARLREEREISREHLARVLNITPSMIWEIETGRARPGDRLIVAAALEFGVRPAEFYMNPDRALVPK